MRVGLLSTIDTNIGDDFIRLGISSVFESTLRGSKPVYVTINKHHPYSVYSPWQKRLNEFFVNRPSRGAIVRQWLDKVPRFPWSRFDRCELIVQCGTPILWQDCRSSEWATPIWRDVLHRLSLKGTPVLNIGGGATYGWEYRPETLVGNADEEFVRLMFQTCRLTTVRDKLAHKLFKSLGHDVEVVCCPALLAGQSCVTRATPTRKVLVNYMEGGGHFDWGQGIDAQQWKHTAMAVVAALVADGWQVMCLAHDRKERDLARAVWPNLECVMPENVIDYFTIIRDAAFGVFNRMHASVAAAGLGIPSIAVGTDARNLMVAELGLPVFYVKEATPSAILAEVARFTQHSDAERSRLLELRESTFRRYAERLAPFFAACRA